MANFATIDLSRATLMDSLSALAGVSSRGVTFYDAKGRPERLSYAELWERALRFAAGLRKLEMAPGDPLDPKTRGVPPSDPMPMLQRGVRGLASRRRSLVEYPRSHRSSPRNKSL